MASFDPSQPFEAVKFDPSQAFEAEDEQADPQPDQGPPISERALDRAQHMSIPTRAMLALEKMKSGKRPEADELDALDQAMRESKESTYDGARRREHEGRVPLLKAQAMAFGHGLTAGQGEKVGGLVRALGSKLGGSSDDMDTLTRNETRDIEKQTKAGRDAYPGTTAAYDIAGKIGAGAAAGPSYVGQGVLGAIQGASDAGDDVSSKLRGAASGAIGGVVGQGLSNYGPAEIMRLAQRAKGGVGAGMERLAKMLGADVPARAPVDDGSALAHEMTNFAAPDSPDVSLGRQMSDELRGMSQAPRAASLAMTAPSTAPFESNVFLGDVEEQLGKIAKQRSGEELQSVMPGIMDDVSRQGAQNVRGDEWQKVPSGGIDRAALERLSAQRQSTDAATRADDAASLRSQISTRTAQRPAAGNYGQSPRAPIPAAVAEAGTKNVRGIAQKPDTAVMGPDEIVQLKGRAMRDNIDAVADIQPYDDGSPIQNWMERSMEKGTSQRAAAKIDNANNSVDIEALDRIMKGGTGTPKTATPPIAPLDAKRKAIVDAQKANPDALAAFGFDPRDGERGFDPFLAYGAYKGIQGAVNTAKKAAPAVGRAGVAMQDSAQQSLSPAAMAKRAVSDPQTIMSLIREGGAVGVAARTMMQSLQSGDRVAMKAQAALLEMNPEFRQRFVPNTDDQFPSATGASGR